MIFRAIVARLGCVRETNGSGSDQFHRADAAAAGGERLPEGFAIRAERGNDADAGDGNAPQATPSSGTAFCAAFWETRSATPCAIWRTDLISRASSSGMSTLNSLSRAKIRLM